VFLMDEPLSNLDAKLRVQMRAEISDLQRELGVTTVYVTHDQVEAMTMGSEVAVFLDGHLQQLSTPRVLYDRPSNRFVAGFIGSPPMNLLEAEVVADGDGDGGAGLWSEVAGQRLALGPGGMNALGPGSRVVVGLRPEALQLAGAPEAGRSLSGVVTLVEELGAEEVVHVEIEPATRTKVLVRTSGASQLSPGDPTHVTVDPTRLHFFDPDGGLAL
jgi:multiple sugar transport system ATP-binding protein